MIVLPGIEGRSLLNRNLALGLDEGGVTSAIEIFDWTLGVPGSLVYNLVDIERNRRVARSLTQRIVDYRTEHPTNPVHLVGHSGGAGLAVLALEALPDDVEIDMAILLAPALSPEYDLSAALRHTCAGIVNFYSENDISLLKIGTSLFGSVDRKYGASAGAVGFVRPDAADATAELYDDRLRQVRWTRRLREYGADGSHIGWTSRRFAREYLAGLIKRNEAARPMPLARTVRVVP